MKAYPLESLSIDDAIQLQFKLVDTITRFFNGDEMLDLGDLGVTPGLNQPIKTRTIEKIISSFFNTEDSVLVRGSGTNAIKEALYVSKINNGKVLLHDAPIYTTTKISLDMLSMDYIKTDFNNENELINILKTENISTVIVQQTRQSFNDNYDYEQIIKTIKENSKANIVCDDNYAVLKTKHIGSQIGADLSCFSSFKLLGPEGIGIVTGNGKLIEKIRKLHYSGGSQVQGHEAMSVLRGLVYAPVSLAIQATQILEIKEKILKLKDPRIKDVIIANAQSKVIIVEFKDNIAKKVLENSVKLGAAPYPVGSESKYEIVPMFYRISKSSLGNNEELLDRTIRINPMRAGADTVIRILLKSMEEICL